ncbi:Bug family tripartite tricarboxylate transporter substrate binding protein [Teichococcus cervicalis]|nr:tripartite tricarboxylate transporter substrate binding protein [Pseudoroseomonas cervicalis]WBV45180.1 tripartite tricarboxylate transporter substrate binding protein [Pseudoroseomonas cervicalis]
MNRRTLLGLGAAAAAGGLLKAPAVWAQDAWPRARPIRLVCPFAPGAATDAMARLAAQKITEKLGANVVVENRTGGGSVIGAQSVQQAPADGYTLLGSSLTHTMLKHVLRNVPFDPLTDFAPIARTGRGPLMMVMTPKRPPMGIAQIVEAAKKSPADWTFAISSLGAPGHLATIDFNRRTGANIEGTSYRGTAPALLDVAAGNAHVMIDATFALLQAARSGQVHPIGISTRERSALAPEIPTLIEAGLPDFEFYSWYGVWAPKGTPSAICDTLNGVLTEAMRDADAAERLKSLVVEPVSQTVPEMRAYIEAEVKRNAELLRIANFQPE